MHSSEPRVSPLVSAPKTEVDHAVAGVRAADYCPIDPQRTSPLKDGCGVIDFEGREWIGRRRRREGEQQPTREPAGEPF
jgi:hypothetical protein